MEYWQTNVNGQQAAALTTAVVVLLLIKETDF
jgi:hypothetical protein